MTHPSTTPRITWELVSSLWRPAVGAVLEGRVVAEHGRWPTITEPMRSIVLECEDGSRVHVLRAAWASLAAELKRVRPLRGDRLRLERLADDAEGRRQFHVERLAERHDDEPRVNR